MSMPSINLDCDKCDYSGSTMVAWGNYHYKFDEQIIALNRSLGWCLDCEGFVAVEDLNNASDILAELKQLTKPLKVHFSKRILVTLSQGIRQIRAQNLDEIDVLATKLKIIIERQGDERCLICSSLNIIAFNEDYALEVNGALYTGTKKTGFTHPVCGGEIIATPNPIRFNMKFTPKYYSLLGIKLDSD